MLTSITLRRFKNLEDVTIPLGRVNVLVGTNNSGKSSVLQGVAFAVSVAQTAKMNGDVTTLSPEQLIYAPLRDVSALARGGDLRQSADHAIEVVFSEAGTDASGAPTELSTTVQVHRGKNKNLAVSINGNGTKSALESLDQPFAMYVPGLAGVPAAEPYRTPAALRHAAARGDANAVLRNVLWSLRGDEKAWVGFSEHLARVFRDHSVQVNFDPNLDEVVDARVESPNGSLPIDAAGTGFLQTVQILAYTAKYRPKLLLLDEPDSHIHPDRQRQLVTLLSELAEDQSFQVVIATHSRHLLDELVQGAKFHWMSNGKRVDEVQTDRVRVLTDLGALDSGDLLKQGAVDAVLLTEDTDYEHLKVLLKASGFDMGRTQVWSCSGCTKIDAAVVLARFIQDHAPGTEVLVHRDRDYQTDADVADATEIFKKKGLRLFVTLGTDTESHFVNVAHIRHHYPQVSEEQVEEVIRAATLDVREKSVSALAKALFDAARAIRKGEGKSGEPDIVPITDRARTDFDANPSRWRHGKKTFGRVIAGLQQLLGENPKLLRPSPALKHSTMEDAATAIAARRAALATAALASSEPANPGVVNATIAPPEELK